MTTSRHARQALPVILALAALCATADASAQELHKLVDTGGHVTFTDRPDATAALQPAPEAEAPRPSRRIVGIASRSAAALIDTREAERRLRQAELARSQGKDPLPGERAKDGTLSPRYTKRQEKLQLAVDRAQYRLQETTQPKLSSR